MTHTRGHRARRRGTKRRGGLSLFGLKDKTRVAPAPVEPGTPASLTLYKSAEDLKKKVDAAKAAEIEARKNRNKAYQEERQRWDDYSRASGSTMSTPSFTRDRDNYHTDAVEALKQAEEEYQKAIKAREGKQELLANVEAQLPVRIPLPLGAKTAKSVGDLLPPPSGGRSKTLRKMPRGLVVQRICAVVVRPVGMKKTLGTRRRR